jgi:hypothetical protein
MCAIVLLLIIGVIVGGFMLGRAERSWAAGESNRPRPLSP